MAKRITTINDKWNKISKRLIINEDDCWVWPGHTNSAGYGMVTCNYIDELPDNKGLVSTHKLSYLQHHNHLRKDHIIMHTCDNRKCCNPDHLVGGTRHDNMLDAMRKGRLRGRNYLEEFGMTRSEFANKLDISPANLSNRLKKWGNPYYNPKN